MGQEEKYMDEYIKEISEKIEDKKEYYAKISDKIWEYAEPRFQEYKSSELLQQTLKKEGFSFAHKSYLLNICHIKKIVRETGRKRDKIIILSDGTSIPLSRNRIEEIEDLFWKWKNELTKG